VTRVPDWVHVAFQPWVTRWPVLAKSNPSDHPLTWSPRLVIFTSPWKPPCHWLTIV
jgi:hypothetical protein